MLGSHAVIEVLKSEGVELVFGYPGAQIIPLLDAFHDEKCVQFIAPRHEQGGIHAAEGYARVTGKVGVAMATSGPGATNLVTGIANAHMDSIPLVAITGQVPSHLIGNDAFQEVDIIGITRTISKHNYLVNDPEDLPFMLKAAFHIAKSGRPGPVVVDIPSNVQKTNIASPIPDKISLHSYQPNYEGNPRQIERIAQKINGSTRPLLYIGGGLIASGASDLLRNIVETTRIPVASTLMGLGAFPKNHPLSLGMLGMHGSFCANKAVMNCDVLIAVGARFDDRATSKQATFAPNATIIHIDIDPTSVSKNVHVHIPIVDSAHNILGQLSPMLKRVDNGKWLEEIEQWKRDFNQSTPDPGLTPQHVIRELSRLSRDRDPILVTDVGQNQMWAAVNWEHQNPRRFVSSGGLGTMGFGLPAAMGAQLGCPDNLVISVSGDGGFQMNIQELATIQRLGLPVKMIILNNGYLGMVRQWQEVLWNKRYAYTDTSDNPDFTGIARAYGIKAMPVRSEEEIASVLSEALDHAGPVVVDVTIDREANVLPMVPAGEALDAMILA